MEERLEACRDKAGEAIRKATSIEELEGIRIEFLGKKGEMTRILRGLGGLDPQRRPKIGKRANEIKSEIEEKLQERIEQFKDALANERLLAESLDISLPGKQYRRGNLHPLVQIQRDLEEIFLRMGFSIADGPEVETEYYNFEALNVPSNHPARDMQDTFYLETGGLLLRTQTSPVQVRIMEEQAPPIRIVAPGRCYRVDDFDATHSPVFHQIEGLMIDKDISFSNLKGVLFAAIGKIFGPERRIRLRPSYFPFTEPSAEVEISCSNCEMKGCRVCSNTGWLEILGAGMVNPKVLDMSGIDSELYTGFAFGIGLDRMAMLKYGIENIKHFWDNDMRFLGQF